MRTLFTVVLMTLIATSASAQGRGDLLANADTNADGQVTRDEFVSARAQHFARLDRNDDGVFDQSDLPRRLARRHEGLGTQADRDGDGKVTREEFVSAPTRVFDAADTDGNDVLDAKELESAKAKLKERAPQRRG